MGEFAHGVMLAGAVAGTGATFARGRGVRALDAATTVAMLAAMLDALFTHAVSPLAWAVVLVIAGLAIGVRARRDRHRRDSPDRAPDLPLADLHHGLALIATGWLLVGADHGGGSVAATHAHALPLAAAHLVIVLPVLVLGAWVSVHAIRTGTERLGHGAAAASMTVMLAAMAAPALVTARGG
ncbi:hypothetical protein GCM10009819_32830 [Agromyces tropicus]|uniref:DUF5134 domain-containing protein n=1 Tax=Agromyces tropicus TaxID=555371 RepID=A0ABP5GBN4_9MICO